MTSDLSFISIEDISKPIGIAFSGLAFVLSVALPKLISEVAFVSARFGIGSIACIAVLIFIFVLNKLVVSRNILPNIKEIDLQRVAIRKQIKKGEITYADLPLPVLESSEEKEKRLQEKEEKEKLVQSAKGEGK